MSQKTITNSWYCLKDDTRAGPIKWSSIEAMLERGEITPMALASKAAISKGENRTWTTLKILRAERAATTPRDSSEEDRLPATANPERDVHESKFLNKESEASGEVDQPEISSFARKTLKILWVILGVVLIAFVAFVVVPFVFNFLWNHTQSVIELPGKAIELDKDLQAADGSISWYDRIFKNQYVRFILALSTWVIINNYFKSSSKK